MSLRRRFVRALLSSSLVSPPLSSSSSSPSLFRDVSELHPQSEHVVLFVHQHGLESMWNAMTMELAWQLREVARVPFYVLTHTQDACAELVAHDARVIAHDECVVNIILDHKAPGKGGCRPPYNPPACGSATALSSFF